jgi:hypothetical protein
MKKVCLIIIVLSSVVFSQEIKTDSKGVMYSDKPFDDCNAILVYTNEKPEEAFKTIGKLLFNDGYELEMRDDILQIITTKFVKKSYGFLGMGSLEMRIFAQIESNDTLTYVRITGKYGSKEIDNVSLGVKYFGETGTWIHNFGMSGSLGKSSWNILNEFALTYPKLKGIEYRLETLKKAD